jgi:hypothetical protein
MQVEFDGSKPEVFVRQNLSVKATEVEAWWPVGMGNQTLYNLTVTYASWTTWMDLYELQQANSLSSTTANGNSAGISTTTLPTQSQQQQQQSAPSADGLRLQAPARPSAGSKPSNKRLLLGANVDPAGKPRQPTNPVMISAAATAATAAAAPKPVLKALTSTDPEAGRALSQIDSEQFMASSLTKRVGFRVVELVRKPVGQAAAELLSQAGGWHSPNSVSVGQRTCFWNSGSCGQWGWVNASRWEFISNPVSPSNKHYTG